MNLSALKQGKIEILPQLSKHLGGNLEYLVPGAIIDHFIVNLMLVINPQVGLELWG